MDFKKLRSFIGTTLQSVEPAKVLWHYTDFNGLKGIIGSRSLRLSHPRYLNDSSEVRYAQELQEAVFSRLSPLGDRDLQEMLAGYRRYAQDKTRYVSFVTSFCEKDDDLDLWRNYADDGSGVALGFASSKLQDALNREVNRSLFLQKVIYEREGQEAIIQSLLDLARTEYKLLIAGSASAPKIEARVYELLYTLSDFFLLFLKHECYKPEKENRLVLLGRNGVKLKDMAFGTQKGYLKPYIDFGFSEEDFPLQTIRVGPASDFERARTSIRLLLDKENINSTVTIKKSSLPYRGKG